MPLGQTMLPAKVDQPQVQLVPVGLRPAYLQVLQAAQVSGLFHTCLLACTMSSPWDLSQQDSSCLRGNLLAICRKTAVMAKGTDFSELSPGGVSHANQTHADKSQQMPRWHES